MTNITKKKKTQLDEVIEDLELRMTAENPASEAYTAMAKNLETLYTAKAKKESLGVSKNTIATIAANLLGIGLILSHEKLNVISTKALGFVLKGRL